MPEVVGDQPPRLDLATRGGGRSASRIEGARGVASPRVRAYEPHAPDFRPSWSLYSKKGRRDFQLVFAAREAREGGCSTRVGATVRLTYLKSTSVYEKKRKKENERALSNTFGRTVGVSLYKGLPLILHPNNPATSLARGEGLATAHERGRGEEGGEW